MSRMHSAARAATLALALLAGIDAAPAAAEGFQINRYEPTAAGEWSFLVDHPWYSSTRYFAGGLTLNYAHDPLVYGTRAAGGGDFRTSDSVIAHQLIGHVDLAGSFLDRVLLTASLPITFLERGQTIDGVGPLSGVGVGDPRFGIKARLWGQPYKSPLSIHLGIDVWAPLKAFTNQGDRTVRVLPKLMLGGVAVEHIWWSATVGFYYRPEATLGDQPKAPGNTMGSELQLGAAVGYVDLQKRFAVAPELAVSTIVIGGKTFGTSYTSMELLFGAHYNVVSQLQLGLALGFGILREPGTPDFRLLFRVAWAPFGRNDRDRDGIADADDKCPDDPEDKDGFEDKDGCPDPDNDKDGILDKDDKCPNEPEDKDGFEDEDGCPDPDNDKDGVLDADDKCPLQPGTPPTGCPDRDGDTVLDPVDNCPDEPGDPANQGCKQKQLVQIRNGKLEILDTVYFKTDSDIIMPRSYDLLKNVASVLEAHAEITKIRVEGHTDSQGKAAHNLDLSERRARSVVRFLVGLGIDKARLEPKGFGQTQPIADNKTAMGRAQNRRVVFLIVGEAGGIKSKASAPVDTVDK